MTEDSRIQAQLNAGGIVSDRRLYLAADQFTVVENGSGEARYMLASPDTLIPTDAVKRLGLVIEGGKVVQKKEAAKGGPESGLTPQSAAWPPSGPPPDQPEFDPASGQPKSDPRFDPAVHKRLQPMQGEVPMPSKEEAKVARKAAQDDADKKRAAQEGTTTRVSPSAAQEGASTRVTPSAAPEGASTRVTPSAAPEGTSTRVPPK